MPVDTRHAQYDYMASTWRKTRSCSSGQRAIHAAGETYLPRLSGQDINEENDRDYQSYLMRALYFNATGRTVDGMTGLIFRKDPVMVVPESLATITNDITLGGKPLRALTDEIVSEVFNVGRVGILVDHPEADDDDLTQRQAERLSLRPKWAIYKTESIINWRTEMVNNRLMLSRVVLHEINSETDEADEFKTVDNEQIRVLDLFNGAYRQRVFVRVDNGYQLASERFPRKTGADMEEIPFYFINEMNGDPDCKEPPISSLCDVNLSHYRTTADYEHGCRYGALPTPWGTGLNEDETPTGIGPNTFWQASSADAKFGMLEFSGQGIQPIVDNLEAKEQKMAALGAEMLLPEKMAAETEGSKRMDKQTQHSVVSSIAASVSVTITKALELTAEWAGIQPGGIAYELNRDYAPGTIDAPLITAMLGAVQSGNMSFETFYQNLQKGELADSEIDPDDEQDRINSRAPVIGGLDADDE